MKKSVVEKANERYRKEAQRLIDENEKELVLTIRIDLPMYLKYRRGNSPPIDDVLNAETLGIFTTGEKILEYYLELKGDKI